MTWTCKCVMLFYCFCGGYCMLNSTYYHRCTFILPKMTVLPSSCFTLRFSKTMNQPRSTRRFTKVLKK
ncbi:hypothetical protein ZOSMA_445G00030 [Zostera marina]|uniref:Uncharacterized protein n=1 Tax=Zostera marina TaxID=29655 RepID=A0A0K9P1D0_ZOSMR|nr:hypothetical protein ZOSMA_445G00030 [Zostera marina]